MKLALARIFLFCLIITLSRSARDPKVCEVENGSCGLIPPALPVNFELKGELVTFANKSLFWHELYYDHLNLRGKYILISKSLEFHHIFDYSVGQIIQYVKLHPGVSFERDPLAETCIAMRIEDSPLKYIFGYRNSNRETKLTHMFNTYEVLRFGGSYPYKDSGEVNLNQRGLRTDSFTGCVYDQLMDATVAATYFFSNNKTLTAAASIQTDGDVSGGLLSVPVMAKFKGTINVPLINSSVKLPYESEENIGWFRADPDFDYDTFKIPRGMYCKNFVGVKQFPELPTSFSTRREYTSFTQDANGKALANRMSAYETIWYDIQRGLARRDFTSKKGEDSSIVQMFGSGVPMKTIFDFNAGIVYIISKDHGRCYARPIETNDFFNTRKESEYVAMASPEELFEMDYDKMEYKGKDIIRGVETDVWGATYYDPLMEKTRVSETYVSARGWDVEANDLVEKGVLMEHIVFTDVVDDEFTQNVEDSHFFQFKVSRPPNVIFDIHTSSCIDDVGHVDLGIKLELTADDFTMISNYKFFFLDALQFYLSDIANVISPLRIQRLNFLDFKGKRFVVFSLLDRPLLQTKVPFQNKGATVQEATDNIQTYIDSGNFTVFFQDPDKKKRVVKANPGSLGRFEMSAQSVKFTKLASLPTAKSPRQKREVPFGFADKVKPEQNVKKGMSPGGLAGLSIAMIIIGIGIGIAVMYLYIRKFSDQSTQDQYAMK